MRTLLLLGCLALGVAVGVFLLTGILVAPAPSLSWIPPALKAETVRITGGSGAPLVGSWIDGKKGMPVVLLLHGVRSNRGSQVARAELFSKLGYSVLFFDFQAHGESPGTRITFGLLEAQDAHAAALYARARSPGARIGVIGQSMGGAAALLGPSPLAVDALILESVYPDIAIATLNRLAAHLGFAAGLASPVLLKLTELRLGFTRRDLMPMDHVGKVTCPLLILDGELDPYTPPSESARLYAAAPAGTEQHEFKGAAHVDLYRHAKSEYESVVIPFLGKALRK